MFPHMKPSRQTVLVTTVLVRYLSRMRTHTRFGARFGGWFALILFSTAALCSLGCRRHTSEVQDSGPPVIRLPAEPAPPLAEKASEVPDLVAKLDADKAYQGVWTVSRDDANLFFTGLSEAIVTGQIYPGVAGLLRAKKLFDAANRLYAIFARKGEFPEDFNTKFDTHLVSTKGWPHFGVWSPATKGKPAHDYSILAAWFRKENHRYLHEMILAKGSARDGSGVSFIGVDPKKAPLRPYLVDEARAWERLALYRPLERDEKERVSSLAAEAAVMKVSLSTLLAEYKDNEVRADARFKGQVVQVAGYAGDVKKDILGNVFIIVNSGNEWEIPEVQCFVGGRQANSVAAINKGDRVTVRGKVRGLTLNVLLGDCSLQ